MEVVPYSTPSSSSPPASSAGICQICSQEGHGVHFGAYTCRACAAFFRRCHFSPKEDAKCNKNNGKCEPRAGRWFCKKCRLDKCLELGMTTDNIQYHRDSFTSSMQFVKDRSLMNRLKDRVTVPPTIEKTLGVPHIAVFFRKNLNGDRAVPFLDVSHIVQKAMESLLGSQVIVRKRRKLTDLEQLAIGLEEYQSMQNEHLTGNPMVNISQQMKDWEVNLTAAAKWIVCSDRMRRLNETAKITLLQSIWLVWGRLERIAMTAKMRVNRQCGKRQFVFSHDSLVDYDEMKVDISWGSQHAYEELAYFLVPNEVFYDEIISEIIEVRPDSVELCFLLLTICLQIAGWQTDGKLEKEIDELHDAFANDLHNYYNRQSKTMYSVRLKQLMKIKEHFMVMWNRRREKFEVAIVLEFFRMQFSVPGYFHTFC